MEGVPTHLRTATALATLEKALEDAEVLDLKVDQATRRDSSRRDSPRRDSSRRDSSRRDSSVGGEMRGPRPSHRNHPVPDRQSGGVEMKPMASSRNQPSASTFDPNVDTYGNALRRFVRGAGRLQTVDQWKHEIAARLTRDTMKGSTFNVRDFRDEILHFGQSSCMRKTRQYLFGVKNAVRIAVVVQMSLALFEPTWTSDDRCIVGDSTATGNQSAQATGANGCARDELILPFWLFGMVESMCVVMLWLRNASELRIRGRKWWRVLSWIATVSMTVDILLFYVLDLNTPRFSRWMRPLMLFSTSRLFRYVTSSFVQTLPKIADIMLLTLIFILFYAVLGMALFTDTIILEMVHNTSYFEDFTSVTRALMLVLDIGTTENIPSVIYPYLYRAPFLTFVYFASFTFFFLWLILPLFLSATYETYCSLQRYMMLKRSSRNQAIQVLVYDVLSLQSDLDQGSATEDVAAGITLDDWIKYCAALDSRWTKDTAIPKRMWNAMIIQQGYMPNSPRNSVPKNAESAAAAAATPAAHLARQVGLEVRAPSKDADLPSASASKSLFLNARLGIEQFQCGATLAAVQNGKLWNRTGGSWRQRVLQCLIKPLCSNCISVNTYRVMCCCLSRRTSERCAAIVANKGFSATATICNLGGAGVLLFFSVANRSDPSIGAQLYWWNFGFVIVTLIEAAVRIMALPAIKRDSSQDATSSKLIFFGEYLDGVFALLAFVAELYYLPEASARVMAITGEAKEFLGLTRAVRVLRLIRLHPGSLKYLDQILRIFDFLLLYLLLYGAITYSFAVLAVELFAGSVTNPSPSGEDYSYLQEQHAACDTFEEAYLILFQLTTQNNWNEVNAIHTRASGPWVWFFFGTYIFLVSIVFQDIVTGVVMDAFEHIHAEESDDDDYDDDDDGSPAMSVRRLRVLRAATRFERWFGMHASSVTEQESEDSIRRHAGALLDQLNGARRRFEIRKRSMSRTRKQGVSRDSWRRTSLPPENSHNPLQDLLDED